MGHKEHVRSDTKRVAWWCVSYRFEGRVTFTLHIFCGLLHKSLCTPGKHAIHCCSISNSEKLEISTCLLMEAE